MTLPGWRALGLTWAVTLAVAAGGAVWLNHLGPPREMAGGEARSVPSAATRISAAVQPTLGTAPEGARESRAADAAAPISTPSAPATTTEAARELSVAATEPTLGTPPAIAGTVSSSAVQDASRESHAATSAAAAARALATAGAAPPAAVPEGSREQSAARIISGLDPTLTEPGRHGLLPRISADGRTPIRAYGRPFDRTDSRPRIAIIIGDFGLNASHSDDALRRLPAAVSLAINPYGYGLPAWSERARERRMETLMGIPMEPAGFPMNDPGDRALLTALPLPENLDRLAWALARTQGYAGAIGAIGGMRGERFAQSGESFSSVQDSLQGRGLLYIDPRPGARNPSRAWGRVVDLVIDEPATRGEIERRLTALEALARERGSALGLAGSPTPVVVDRIATWAQTLSAKGLVLAPASVLIRRPDGISETTSRTQ
jgi:hypothetical protein